MSGERKKEVSLSEFKLKNIFVFFKPDKAFEVLNFVGELSEMGFSVYVSSQLIPSDTRDLFKKKGVNETEKIDSHIDIVLVFGGDGAILRACHEVINSGFDIPILGINIGRLGFLSFGEGNVKDVFAEIEKGNFIIERKRVLKCFFEKLGCVAIDEKKSGYDEERGKIKFYAVNDFVVKAKYGLLEADIFFETEYVGNVRADGILISTPLGSTAYNLSVGGPIVYPDADVVILSFISPFTLSSRPVIFPSDKEISLNLKSESLLFTDGREDVYIKPETKISFVMDQKTVRIVRKRNSQFFLSLRKKFGWLGG